MLSRRQFLKSASGLFVPTVGFLCGPFVPRALAQWNAFNRSPTARADSLLQGLTSYWKLDELGLANKSDSVDSNTISETLGFVTVAAGLINNCVVITGTGTDGYQCANNANLQMGAGIGFTISIWFIPTADNNGVPIVSKWNASNSNQQEWWVGCSAASSSNPRLTVKDLNNNSVTVTFTGALNGGAWNHIAAGFDPFRQAIWIQLNGGARVFTACNGVIKVGASPPQFAMGQFSVKTTAAQAGYYDEMGFWRRSLTTDEVAGLYSNGIGFPYPFTTTRAFDIANDWATRVITNGGAMPSRNTVEAIETFINNLALNGVYFSIQACNIYAPDNLTACRTPLIHKIGIDPWGNIGPYVNGDLTVNGLVGDGATKALNTGAVPSDLNASNYHMALYNSTGNNNSEEEIGAWHITTGFDLFVSFTGTSFSDMSYAGTNGRISAANSAWTGYLCGSRVANNDERLFKANSGTAHTQIASGSNVVADERSTVPDTFYVGANHDNGAIATPSTKRISFASLGVGLSAAQSAAFFNCIQALRTSLGGGFV